MEADFFESLDVGHNRDSPDGKPFDVFISFSTADRRQPWFGSSIDVVAELKSALERYRHPDSNRRLRVCTYDEDFELGKQLRPEIAANIDRSTAVIFLSAKNAASSDYVRFEVQHAATSHPNGRLLAAVVDRDPGEVFPSIFSPGTHAADLSTAGCADRKAWRRRVELEAAKLAARIWDVPLKRVRDRFVIEQRRRRLFSYGGSAIALAAVAIVSMLGIEQYRKREAARVLAVHQQYAADMTTVQRAWTEGRVDQVRAALERYHASKTDPDPRTFDWYTYARVAAAERHAFGKPADPVTGLAVSPRAELVAFSTLTEPVRIVSANDGQSIATLSRASVEARSMGFNADGSILGVIVQGGVLLWDTRTRRERLIPASEQDPPVALAFLPGGVLWIVGGRSGSAYQLDGDRLRLVKSRLFSIADGFRFWVTPNGDFLVGADADGTVQVINAGTRAVGFKKRIPDFRSDQDLAVTDSLAFILTGDRITTMNLRTGETGVSRRIGDGVALAGVAVDASGELVAAGDPTDQSIVLLQPTDWREAGTVKGYQGWLHAIRFVPGSTKVVAGSLGGDVKVWDLTDVGRKLVQEHPGNMNPSFSCRGHPMW